jgi:hypothetical protein
VANPEDRNKPAAIRERLQALATVHDDGVITEDEHEGTGTGSWVGI